MPAKDVVRDLAIKDVMHEDVRTCSMGDSLESVAMTMWNDDCGAVPVVDEDRHTISILTDRDIVMAAALQHRPLWEMNVQDLIAGKALRTCRAEDEVKSALDTMSEYKVRRLPVVDDRGRLAGIVSTKDLVDHCSSGRRSKKKEIPAAEIVETLREICRPNALKAVA